MADLNRSELQGSDLQGARRNPFRFLRRHEPSLLLAIVLVVVLAALFDSQHNYLYHPWLSGEQILRQTSLLGIFALGSAIVIIAGGIDLSSGSVICFSGMICATLLLVLAPERMRSGNTPIDLSILAIAMAGTLVVGLLIGSLHAWLITVVRLPPFIATLATLVGLRSFAWAICGKVTDSVLGAPSSQIQIYDSRFRYLATSVWIPAVVFLALAVFAWMLLSKTVLGRHLYALGGNEEAARLSGVRTDHLKWFAYCFSSVTSSIAGILYICEVSVANITLGSGYELNSIAAAVVGGCSLQGGIGTIEGTVLGTIFLRTVIDAVSKVIKTNSKVYEGLIVGVVVVVAVAFSQTAKVRKQISFFAGAMGLVAAVNLSLIAGAMAILVGPTLLEGRTFLPGSFLGLWVAVSAFLLLLFVRSPLSSAQRRTAAIGVAAVALGLFFGLDKGLPAYQNYAARAAVRSAGGKLTTTPDGNIVVDFGGTKLDDQTLIQIVDRLRSLSNVTDLSLSGTKVTDKGIASIKALTTLKHLDLTGTDVSRSEKRSLGRLLPDVEITD